MERMRITVESVTVEDDLALAKVMVRSRKVIRGRPSAVMEMTMAFESKGIEPARLKAASRNAALDYRNVSWKVNGTDHSAVPASDGDGIIRRHGSY